VKLKPDTTINILLVAVLVVAAVVAGFLPQLCGAADDDYLKWQGVTSVKLQKATEREKMRMAQEAIRGYHTYCMEYGATQDCDLAVNNRVQTCIEYKTTGADGESWIGVVCRPRGAQTAVYIYGYTPCAANPACGAIQGEWWAWNSR